MKFKYNNKWCKGKIIHTWIFYNKLVFKDVPLKYFKNLDVTIRYQVVRRIKNKGLIVSQGYIVKSEDISTTQ